jgi:hypothetical protein
MLGIDVQTSAGFRQHRLGHSNAMNAYTPGTGKAWSANDPVCRVVWNAWSGQVEGITVWNPQTWSWNTVLPTGSSATEVRATFANMIGEEIANAILSGTGISPPASQDELFGVVEALLDRQVLILDLVQATAQVAALHAGFPPPIARLVGHIAREIGKDILGQDPQARRVQVARWAEFAFSAETGSWIGSSALREPATADISGLLGSDGPHHPPRPVTHEPSPAAGDRAQAAEPVKPHNVEDLDPGSGPGFSP